MFASIVVVTLAAASAVAMSEPGWSPVEPIPAIPRARGSIVHMEAASGANGNAVVVWTTLSSVYVWGSFRDGRTGSWLPVRKLGRAHSFSLAGDRASSVVLVLTGDGSDSSQTVSVRTGSLSSRRWSRPRAFGRGPSYGEPPAVAIDRGRNATVVWQRGDERNAADLAIHASLRTGSWTRPSVLAARGAEEPQLALDASGGAVVTWTRCLASRGCWQRGAMESPTLRPYRLETRGRPGARGRWQRVEVVGRMSLYHIVGTRTQRVLLTDPGGGVTVVWTEAGRQAVASHRPPGAARWTPPARLTPDGITLTEDPYALGGWLEVVSNARGDAVLSWVNYMWRTQGALIRRAGEVDWLSRLATRPQASEDDQELAIVTGGASALAVWRAGTPYKTERLRASLYQSR
jgi:hypothetical protein